LKCIIYRKECLNLCHTWRNWEHDHFPIDDPHTNVVIFSLSAGRVAPPVFGGIKIRRKNSIEQERRGRGSDSLFICAATAEQRLHNAPQTERHTHAHTRGLIEVKAKAKQKQKQGKSKQTQSGDPTEWVVWSQQSQTEKTEPMANISPMENCGENSNNFKLPPPI